MSKPDGKSAPYQVSGEYAGLVLLAEQGLIKFEEALREPGTYSTRRRPVHHYVRRALCEGTGIGR